MNLGLVLFLWHTGETNYSFHCIHEYQWRCQNHIILTRHFTLPHGGKGNHNSCSCGHCTSTHNSHWWHSSNSSSLRQTEKSLQDSNNINMNNEPVDNLLHKVLYSTLINIYPTEVHTSLCRHQMPTVPWMIPDMPPANRCANDHSEVAKHAQKGTYATPKTKGYLFKANFQLLMEPEYIENIHTTLGMNIYTHKRLEARHKKQNDKYVICNEQVDHDTSSSSKNRKRG